METMRKFIERALAKLSKLDTDQIHALMSDLAFEHERLNGVLDSLSDGIMVADVENNLIMFNKAAERLVPFAGSEGYERPIWESITDNEISRFVEQTLESQESIRDREFALDRSGMTRLLAFSLTPLVRNGQIQGTIIHVEDVSERRGREARLRRADSLASLTTLAAGVAHEIKNPLGSIGIHMQLIQKAFSRIDAEEIDQLEGYVDVVNEEVERLNRIVVDFLFAVRPMDTKLEDRDLNGIVHDLLEFVRFELDEADIEIHEELGEDLPTLELDEKYLKQALLNIVKNAISAMPDGGVLTASSRQQGDVVVLTITDTGLGMSDEILSKIFEPYFTTKDFGSGIGLTMVYKVAKEHMGDVSVVSQEGKGSSFSISFPVPQREQHLLNYEGGT